jgi:hypothetical protein
VVEKSPRWRTSRVGTSDGTAGSVNGNLSFAKG